MQNAIFWLSRLITFILISTFFLLVNALFAFLGLTPRSPEPYYEDNMVRGGDEPGEVRMQGLELRGNELISPFQSHLRNNFKGETELEREEIQERFLMSLEGLANEITFNVGAGKAWGEVEMEEVEGENYLTGHLHWDIDKFSPKVYAISMALLLDGFVYIAERNAYMITSKVMK